MERCGHRKPGKMSLMEIAQVLKDIACKRGEEGLGS